MKLQPITLLLSSLVHFLFIPPLLAGSVSGQVQAPKQVKELIIYLTSDNALNQNEIPQKHIISQKDIRFKPELSIIMTNDSIEWENNESKEIDHNIFSLSPVNRFDLGLGEKGSKFERSFKKNGVLNYYCSVHKEMEGKVIILPNRHYQHLVQSTDFKIDNLPEGEWTLNAVVFHRRYKAEPIKVTIRKETIKNLSLKIVKR